MCKIAWNLSEEVQKQPPCFSDVCCCWLQHYITVNTLSIATESGVEFCQKKSTQHQTVYGNGPIAKHLIDSNVLQIFTTSRLHLARIPDEFQNLHIRSLLEFVHPLLWEDLGPIPLHFPPFLLIIIKSALYFRQCYATLTHLWVCTRQDYSYRMLYGMSSDTYTVASGPLALGIALFKYAYTLSASSNTPGAAQSRSSIWKHYRFTLFAEMKFWCWIVGKTNSF